VGTINPPQIFALPFSAADATGSINVTNGWKVANDEVPFTGDFTHGALDFEFPNTPDHGYGLPIYAAADGAAYYSYQYLSGSFTDPDGITHQVGWGGGLFVEIQHEQGWVSQYIHLSRVAPGIPYLAATPKGPPGDWYPTGIMQPRDALLKAGQWVRQGTLLGWLGDTGIGYDYQDAFDPSTGTVAQRDRVALPPWDPAQLHFQIYHGRNPATWSKQGVVDPSGVYGRITTTTNPYAVRPGKLCVVPSLMAWQTNKKGQLLYAVR